MEISISKLGINEKFQLTIFVEGDRQPQYHKHFSQQQLQSKYFLFFFFFDFIFV